MLDLDNDFYKNPGKFIYESKNVSFDNFDSSRKEFVKSKLRHNSYTDLKYFRGISDMTQFYKLCVWDYLYDGIDESEVTDFIYGDVVNGVLYCIIPMDDIGSFEKNGLIPRQSFDRIVLYSDMESVARYIVEHRYDYCSFSILKINLKDKRFFEENDITTHYRFFDDPKSEGIFTYEDIDPMCISVYKTIEMEDTDDFEFVLEFLNDK